LPEIKELVSKGEASLLVEKFPSFFAVLTFLDLRNFMGEPFFLSTFPFFSFFSLLLSFTLVLLLSFPLAFFLSFFISVNGFYFLLYFNFILFYFIFKFLLFLM